MIQRLGGSLVERAEAAGFDAAPVSRRPAVGKPYDGFVCFACGDWWYHNRGHFDMQIMRRFSRLAPLLYVNAMGMRFPSVAEGRMFKARIGRKLRSVRRGFVRHAHNFNVFTPLSLPVYGRPLIRKANALFVRFQVQQALRCAGIRRPIAWVVSPPASDIVFGLRAAAVVYQRTDDYREFMGVNREAIADMDDRLVRRADLVVHVNREMYEDSLFRGGQALLVSHGVDYDLFAAPDGDSEPPDIAAIPHPRIGFFGGIDEHTFDPGLLNRVASAAPDLQFVLVGANSLPSLPLFSLPNVHLLGQKPYEQIPVYGRAFDAAIMPWRQNTWIARCNPVKLKEYLALGKPIVSTPYPEGMAYSDVVYFAPDAAGFGMALRRAIREDSAVKQAQRRARVRGHTWDALAKQILDRIEAEMAVREAANG